MSTHPAVCHITQHDFSPPPPIRRIPTTPLHPPQAIRTLISEEVKTNAAARCAIMIEHFWRVRGVPGAYDYNQVLHRMLQRNNLRLPLTCAGKTPGHCVILPVPSTFYFELPLFDIPSGSLMSVSLFAVSFLYHPFLPLLALPGHDCDDMRDYTHHRLQCPGKCQCFHCQAKPYEWEKDKEIWERVRLREAKRGVYLMSWDMKVEIELEVRHRA
jgi:hypothetical protein